MSKTSILIAFQFLTYIFSPLEIMAQEAPYIPIEEEVSDDTEENKKKYILVDYYTADVLAPQETKLGLDYEYSPWGGFMVGTDLLALSVGAPSIHFKQVIFKEEEHQVALGLAAAYFDKSTALWGFYSDHFETLHATILRPSISWSHKLSDRLKLHTYWGVGFGENRAQLTEKGKRALWESKNPDGDWESRNNQGDSTQDENQSSRSNQEEKSHQTSLSARTLQLQALTGILTDVFSITGEFQREKDKKLLITTRIEQSNLERLKSNGIRITAAQQWIFSSLQFRIGIGLQYQILSGYDLDGEEVDDTGIYPATDIDFYWRF